MKNFLSLIICLIIVFSFSNTSCAQQDNRPEVFIMGTMHGVPKIVKKAYRPLLKRAKKYQPEAIFVEFSPKEDTLSRRNAYPWFQAQVDSIRNTVELDLKKIKELQNKATADLSKAECKLLSNYYLSQADLANSRYYHYLSKYSIHGHKTPYREENNDLSYPLAAKMGHKEIYSMDFQQDRREYGKYANACYRQSNKDKEIKYMVRPGFWSSVRGYTSAAFGRLAHYTNSKKTVSYYHDVNSFRFRKTDCESCDEGRQVWDRRNQMMVSNIAQVILAKGTQKNIVIVGAGHVYGMKEFFEKEYPEIRVKVMYEH